MKEYLIGFDARVNPAVEQVHTAFTTDANLWERAVPEPDPYQATFRQDLYNSIVHLQAIAPSGSWIIAITEQLDPDELDQYPPIIKEFDLTSWQFLGFDVSDYFLLSGMNNCGYFVSSDQIWKPLTNQFGLFVCLSDAERYCQFADEFCPEHAPFSVYGIYANMSIANLGDIQSESPRTVVETLSDPLSIGITWRQC